jgi:hypothetical protein
MELHLDLDNLEKLFTQLNSIPDLKLDDKSVRNFILTLSELEVDKSGRFRLPAADRNSSAFVDMSVVMSDVDVPDIEVSGTPELVAENRATGEDDYLGTTEGITRADSQHS